MGRNYISERAITDPVQKAQRKRKKAKIAATERASLAAYLARAKWCSTGCGKPITTSPVSWFPCCSETCWKAWNAELTRREEIRAARKQGIPVKEYRKREAEKAAQAGQ